MASFIGTKEDFNRYIGPFLRNLVQQITRKYKNEVGCCQHCGSNESLEAAHIHGRERGSIIDSILSNYTIDNTITLNLTDFEKDFKSEHKIIDSTIIILCKPCHNNYDSKIPRIKPSMKSISFRDKVIALWKKNGSKKWGYERTLKACIDADQFFKSKNKNPAKKFREKLESNDEVYLRQWVMGCHFVWLNPRA